MPYAPDRYAQIPPLDDQTGHLNAVVETPKGSRIKYKYDERLGLFRLNGFMPLGAMFPFDFGFLPGTLGEDGDPLDVLLLMDQAAFPGCLVPARLVGMIEAEQTEGGETIRNDRLIAVASASRLHGDVTTLSDLNPRLLQEIEHFFSSYNAIKGRTFRPLGRHGPETARRAVTRGTRAGDSSPMR